MTVMTKSADAEYPIIRIAPVRLFVRVSDDPTGIGCRFERPSRFDIRRTRVAVGTVPDVLGIFVTPP